MVQHLSIFAWCYQYQLGNELPTNHLGDSHFPRELLAANILGRHDSCDFWSPRGASCLVKQLGKKYTHRIKANHRVNQSTSDVICFVPKKSRGFGEIYSNKMLKLIAKGDTRKNQWMALEGFFQARVCGSVIHTVVYHKGRIVLWQGAWPWPINLFSFVGFMFISFRIHVLHGLNINPCHKKASKTKTQRGADGQ